MDYQDVFNRCHRNKYLTTQICYSLRIRGPKNIPDFSKEFKKLHSKWFRQIPKGGEQIYFDQMHETAESFDELLEVILQSHMDQPEEIRRHLDPLFHLDFNKTLQKMVQKAVTFEQKAIIYEVSFDKDVDKWALEQLIATGTFDDWYWICTNHEEVKPTNLYMIAIKQMTNILRQERAASRHPQNPINDKPFYEEVLMSP